MYQYSNKKMAAVPMLAGVGLMMVCCSSSSAMMMMGGGEETPDAGAGAGAGAGAAEETIPNVLSDPVGTPIQCTANDVGSGVNAAVYRYMGGTELRHYPNPPIATSWDPDWGSTYKKIDCDGLTEGEKMSYNTTVGDPVQCTANDVGSGVNAAVYRVEADNVLRHYPNPPIATSWDPDWGSTYKKIDCIGFTQGAAMAAKP
jgi:hypothetical protein